MTVDDVMAIELGALPPVEGSERRQRIAALRAAMHSQGLAAVILASPESVYHLTGLDHLGYFAPTLLLVPSRGRPVLVARRMEQHTLRAQAPQVEHVGYDDGQDPAEATARAIRRFAPGRIGVEEQSLFLPPGLLRRIHDASPNVSWVECSRLAADLRTVKSVPEQERVRRAAMVSNAAMRAALATAATGVNERTVAARTHLAMIEAGGEPPGFAPLIRSTARLAQEHVTWTDHVLSHGEGLFVELSGCVQRYHAPMSRIVYCGEAPLGTELAARAALAGLDAARAALKPGAVTRDVYGAWEDAVADATGVRQRRHHCGYLTGIGFAPSWVGGGEVLGIRADGATVVEPGMVFHLMSWVSQPVPHVVSDTALVTATGHELLTDAPRGLLVADGVPIVCP
ncbi:M24 family metallopeptidase [Stackebrandtia nassauensis]|uniref:Creatinase n=1 Tax=Stackebrandtia nassauensis (strain DSM 44728 / CIP 108903 / NRRL B-16338 / NBRC 102104 / LLR-40K-21) TaxID=446470 RepID=D3PVP5_STANL|nr:Xaa-Pro peptidase family protein [Stackebrandtia nassauensis]ADD43159.1 creatinase [Stackebrandtia nassauensis DSM 44728]